MTDKIGSPVLGSKPGEKKTEHLDNSLDVGDCQGNFVSGYGSFHSQNPESQNPKDYIKISFQDILKLAENPPSVDKSNAQWVLPSSTGGPGARVHQFQRENGQFHALWADLDKVEGKTFYEVITFIKTAIPGVQALVYTTKSAGLGNPKSRVIIPLEKPISGSDYVLFAKILNDKIQAQGLTPDRASERPGQFCYLPNKGGYYAFEIL